MTDQAMENPTIKAFHVWGRGYYGAHYLNLERARHKRIKWRWGYEAHGTGVSFHLTPWGAYLAWRRFRKQPVSPW